MIFKVPWVLLQREFTVIVISSNYYHGYIYCFQGIFSVIRRHSEIYLFVKIEKVLQGPISQSMEPYLKGGDPKQASKVYKQMKQFCANIGHHRMPFAWSAR